MKIFSFNSPNIPNIINKTSNPIIKSKGLEQDTFEKKNVSFSGLFDNLFNSIFEMNHIKKELSLQKYFEIYSDKQTQNSLKQCAAWKVEKLHDIVPIDALISRDYVEGLLADAGLVTVQNVSHFAKNYLGNPDVKSAFRLQTIEAVKIYSLLNKKDNLKKYPDLLLYLYTEEEAKKSSNFENLNKYADFLSEIGLNSSKDFDSKFAHLKSTFNEFESVPDKIEAVDYLLKTHEAKKKFLNNLFVNERINPDSFYRTHNDIVDYAFLDIQNGSAENYPEIFKMASMSEKMKSSVKNKLAENFNDFKTVEDKILFYQFLIEANVTPSDCNKLLSKSIVTDIEEIDNVLSKDSNIKNLTPYCKNRDVAQDYYFNFKDVVNVVDSSEKLDFADLISVTKRFNIKNQDDLLAFYNKATNKHHKNIQKEELINFIELFKYSNSSTILEEAKAQKTTAVEILEKEKENYKIYENSLNEFILNDSTDYFTGKTPLDLYKEYKSVIIENPDNIEGILKNIVDFNIMGSEEYTHKLAEISKFEQYFPDKKSLIKFFADNQITFETEDEEYRNSCVDVLKTLSDGESIESSQQKINQLSKTKFLVKSKTYLSDFVNSFENKNQKKETLELIIDKKVSSAKEWKDFIKKYKGKGFYDSNIVAHLKSQNNDIDFKTYSKILFNIQEKIDKHNIPCEIKSKNINKLGEFLPNMQNKISEMQLIKFVNNMTDTPDNANFISTLPSAFVKDTKTYSSFQIADEIASIHEKDGESYNNIEEKLNISKRVLVGEEEAGYYNYVKCIEENLPKEFVNFVNSPDVFNFTGDKNKKPNLTLHARLRAIDRFILKDTSINDLYSEKTIKKLQNVLEVLYTQTPNIVEKKNPEYNKMLCFYTHGQDTLKTVFDKNGALITFIVRD